MKLTKVYVRFDIARVNRASLNKITMPPNNKELYVWPEV